MQGKAFNLVPRILDKNELFLLSYLVCFSDECACFLIPILTIHILRVSNIGLTTGVSEWKTTQNS